LIDAVLLGVQSKRMRLILIGPPGSGKGTQAKLLCEGLGLLHFSTGDILRDAVSRGTPEGKRAALYMNAGQLVPDGLVNDIVRAHFVGKDKPQKFIMDGYPRTLSQAVAFDGLLGDARLPLNAVVYLKVDDNEIVRRLGGRFTCSNADCKAIYNVVWQPPKVAGKCDLCQSPLVQRDDDKPETIRKRLLVFHDLHDSVVEHYRKQGLLVEVAGSGDIEMIHGDIVKSLKGK
jgi:adenylate kinase